MYKDGENPEHHFSGVDFQICPIVYHTCGCTVSMIEDSLQGGLEVLPKWKPMSRAQIYTGHFLFLSSSVALILNITTGHVYPYYYAVFDVIFSTV